MLRPESREKYKVRVRTEQLAVAQSGGSAADQDACPYCNKAFKRTRNGKHSAWYCKHLEECTHESRAQMACRAHGPPASNTTIACATARLTLIRAVE